MLSETNMEESQTWSIVGGGGFNQSKIASVKDNFRHFAYSREEMSE